MTTTKDKQEWRERAFEDIATYLVSEISRSTENWMMWQKESYHHPDRLKWLAYWSKKGRILNGLMNKLLKYKKD